MKIIAGIIIMAVILTGTAIGLQTGEDNSSQCIGMMSNDGTLGYSEAEDGYTVEIVDKGVPPEDIIPYESPFKDFPVIENPGDPQYLDPNEPYPLPQVHFPLDIIWITPLD